MARPTTPLFFLPCVAQPHGAYHDDIVVPGDLQKTNSPCDRSMGGMEGTARHEIPPTRAAAPDVQVQRIALEACHRRRR